MTLLVLVVVTFVVWSTIGTLRRRIDALEARLSAMAALEERIARLLERVHVLERGHTAASPDADAPHVETASGPVPPVSPPLEPVGGVSADVPVPVDVTAPMRAPMPPVPLVVERAPKALPIPVAAVVADTVEVVPAPVTSQARPAATDTDTWEVVVGTSWLNKIGVLILVMGLALLLGYSMTNIGPAGRVVIGFVLSAALAGAGVVLERRAETRTYGQGLIAGGWAGAYVTAFAMRALPAARVIDSDVTGLVLLLAIAAGMVVHSLKYRSEAVTTLAYVAAYVPLAFTPLTTYSLIASVPLVVSLLVVAQRLGWSSISAFGLASTYGIFALRGTVLPGGLPDATAPAPYLVLFVYWLAFEIADVTGLRSSRAALTGRRVPLFALNAVGSPGAALLLADRGGEGVMVTVLGAAAAAYFASAIVRARLVPAAADGADASGAFTTMHASLALSAALVAWATDIRMAGPQQTFALLLLAELLVAAGLVLGDRQVRRVGSAMAAVVTAHLFSVILFHRADALVWPWTMAAWTPAALVVVAAWYANGEWSRARGAVSDRLEWAFPWAALVTVGAIVGHDVAAVYQGLAGVVVAVVLLEADIRRGAEYRWQSYAALVAGVAASIAAFGPDALPPSRPALWGVMPLTIAALYGYAWRVRQAAGHMDAVARLVLGFAGSAGTTLLTIFEWRVLPEALVGVAWGATALGLVAVGVRRGAVALRWQAYALFALTVTYVSQWALSEIDLADRAGITAVAVPIVALVAYAAAYAGAFIARARQVAGDEAQQTTVQLERLALFALPLITTLHLVSFESVWLGTRFVSIAWAITGVALLAAGLMWRAVDLRVQAYGVFVMTALVTWFFIVARPEDASILWIAVATAAFYVTGLAFRGWLRAAGAGEPDWVRRLDAGARLMLLAAATVLLATLIGVEARPSLVTMGWGLQGTALLFTGFAGRERALRLAGLLMLFVCILKLFLYDLRELEALARILSFVVLGLVLLGVSWTYTRYKEQIRKLF